MTQIVQMQGMNKYFGKLHVLKDIDLTVEQGEVVVIIGASGSGKSTLIRCVNGLEEFESGHLKVDGHELAPKSGNPKALAEIRKEVGMVFQQFNLIPYLGAEDNIKFRKIGAEFGPVFLGTPSARSGRNLNGKPPR